VRARQEFRTIPSLPRLLPMGQISRANRNRSSGGVAWIMVTASDTLIVPSESPMMLITALIHSPNFSVAPDSPRLYCRVRRPSPKRRSVSPYRTLHGRQVAATSVRRKPTCNFIPRSHSSINLPAVPVQHERSEAAGSADLCQFGEHGIRRIRATANSAGWNQSKSSSSSPSRTIRRLEPT
jgi:hypothetical protein